MWRRIGCGYDSETALGGARWAAEFAARRSGPLTLLHVTPRLEWHFTGTEHHRDAGGDGDSLLAAAADAVRSAHPDLVIRTEAVRGAVAPTV